MQYLQDNSSNFSLKFFQKGLYSTKITKFTVQCLECEAPKKGPMQRH